MVGWGLLTFCFAASVLLTWVVIQFSTERRWLDRPIARSAHQYPMPSGGGIAMAAVFVIGVAIATFRSVLELETAILFAGCLPLVLVGCIDDLRNLSIGWRLPVQVASALWVVYWVGHLPALELGPVQLENNWIIRSLAVLSFVWFVNLFNFMDGIDGLAASEAVYVMSLSCLLIILADDATIPAIAPLLIAVSLGFLFWNWPPAKVFMGDAGSNFLGFVIGALALASIADGSLSPWVWLLLLAVFVVDSTYTLVYRYIDRQPWYQGHNLHAYQHAARLAGSHRKVTLGVIVINLLWLSPLAWLATESPENGFYLAVTGVLPLLYLARKLKAGRPDVAG